MYVEDSVKVSVAIQRKPKLDQVEKDLPTAHAPLSSSYKKQPFQFSVQTDDASLESWSHWEAPDPNFIQTYLFPRFLRNHENLSASTPPMTVPEAILHDRSWTR